MSLVPIKTPPAVRKILVYDLEWYPESYELRLIGVYDGERYRFFTTLRDFFNFLLQPAWKGHWIYAHAGGLADMLFLLQKVSENQAIRVTAAFSGSSAIMVKLHWKGAVYTFLDSYWLLRDKLAHLAPFVNMKKGRGSYKCSSYPECGHVGRACESAPECGCELGPEPLCMFHAPLSVLKTYNEADCTILHRAICLFQDTLADMGASLRMTIASTALGLFRTRYLQKTIETLPAMNDTLRASYIASRVEVFRSVLSVKPGQPKVKYYDFNSMFPTAMTKPLPGEFLATSRSLPGGDTLYFADADVRVPEMYLPPLGCRGRDGRIYFPVGAWRGLFSKPDLDLLLAFGGSIEKVHEVWHYHAQTDLALYALDLYDRRARAKKAKEPFLALVLKYLLNSCYGKFGEHREKTEMVLHPSGEGCPHGGEHDAIANGCMYSTCVEPLFPGCILVTEEKQVAHEHVPIASTITSYARSMLYTDLLSPCGEDLYYCDTDSGLTGKTLPTGPKLGELKLEYEVSRGRFIQPKLYEIDGRVKSKGFSRLTPEQFEDLIQGREVKVERMYRVKEMAREMKRFGAMTKTFGKSIRVGASRPKRRLTADGGTLPWTAQEIQEKWTPAERQ
jgi:hypothetical protein